MFFVRVGCLVASAVAVLGCASAPINVGEGSVLGEGGLPATNQFLARHDRPRGTFASYRVDLQKSGDAQTLAEASAQVRSDYAATLAQCNAIFTRLERQADDMRWTSFTIAIIGSLAGAVAVPALAASNATGHRAAIAAWGGVSGAANTAQSVLKDQGLTAADALQTREGLRTTFNASVTDYLKANNDDDRTKAIVEMAGACTSYAIQIPGTKVTATPVKGNGQ